MQITSSRWTSHPALRTSPPPQNLADLLFGVINLMHLRSSQPDPRSIDCLIRPDVAEFNAWAFNDIDEIIARGRIAANQVILKLKADLHV